MYKERSISTSQLFCLLFLCRLSAEIIYPRTVSGTPAEAVLALIIAETLRFALALPVVIYSFKGSNIHSAVYKKNKLLGWCGAVFAALLLAGAALRTLFNSSQFAVKNLLNGGTMWIIFAVSAIFAVYAALTGVEALARSGAIFLIAAALVTVTVMLADIPYMHTDGLSARGDFSALLGDIIERVLRGGDYLIFAALLPYVNKKKSSSAGLTAMLFAVFSLLGGLLITVTSCLVLRDMYGLCEYPHIAAASLSDVALFKRLDGASAAVWTLCAAFRSGVMLFAAGSAIAEVYRAGHAAKRVERSAE
ncbi:MAG: GerAB/ArcD/ProY family transporter [Lachnospiraceae bacterium]|nr:GerAB/ArcD/ProY family transporter [Ruminococcus sp.]MCM1274212.1 GerAB/ArcD/ProY family transporter [Lachnospiraceae bacterium]